MAATVATRERTAPQKMLQGIAVPAEAVNPGLFMELTRRHIGLERSVPYVGQPQETFQLRKSDILSSILVRFSGTVTIANGTGTTRTTSRWPYDLIKAAKLSANGVSNIISASGLKLKIRDVMKRSDLTDRGIQYVGGVERHSGTLARSSESWGVGSNTTGLANGTYDIELEWHVPVAEDEHDLAGALFLQTTSADLTLELSFEPLSGLFVTTGDATTPDLDGTIQVISTKFSIPVANGQMVVPDLSFFHSLIQNRWTSLQHGEQEIPVIGTGAGKLLLRTFYQVYNGASPTTAPVPMTSANFGKQMWRYATSETPDEFIDGTHMRIDQERRYNSDVGGVWGVACHDFVHENARRDAVDLGTTSELRLVTTIKDGVSLTGIGLEYVTETLFAA